MIVNALLLKLNIILNFRLKIRKIISFVQNSNRVCAKTILLIDYLPLLIESDSELGYLLMTVCSWKTQAHSLIVNIVYLENILSPSGISSNSSSHLS